MKKQWNTILKQSSIKIWVWKENKKNKIELLEGGVEKKLN